MAGSLAFAIIVAGCAGAAPVPASPATAPLARASQSPSAQPSRDEVAQVLAGLSLEEKVGLLFMPATADARLVRKYRLGGVILFPEHVKSVPQVVSLTNGLQKAAGKVPLLIGTDQENGLVSRMGAVMTKLPGASVIGATGDPSLSRAAAKATGEELRALGVNLDFAPVADVNVNPRNPVIGKRAYGNDPGKVATMVAAAVKGFRDAGVASTAKHFPGHGDTTVDSHTGLPVIRHSRAQWEKLDAPPFKAAVEAGVDAVMSAHIVMPALDPSGDPATLSKPILTGLLREKLGFTGVISTDALNMKGVRTKYGDGEVAVRAVLAGADLLLMPPDLGKAYRAVLAAVKSGRISRERLDQSVTRLLELRRTHGILHRAPVASAAEATKTVRSAEHRELAAHIQRESR
ncbi:glycoside hydrolase family 3 protein [Thermoactinospora rubra]|uniref:glycoside hydrolase family 3 protein n=1 Tax=Thermoactinospora rubra TaxID=1088767 RepID=UPI001F0A183C|nr:glycoside hydrolase family 3 protein [Thermoactinospora rubra]